MRGAALWTGTLALSTLLHVGLAALVVLFFVPRPVEQKPATTAEMSFSTLSVPQSQATEAVAEPDPTQAAAPTSQGIGPRTIPQSTAKAQTPLSRPATPADPMTAKSTATEVSAPYIAPARSKGTALTERRADTPRLPSERPDSAPLTANTPDSASLTDATPDTTPLPQSPFDPLPANTPILSANPALTALPAPKSPLPSKNNAAFQAEASPLVTKAVAARLADADSRPATPLAPPARPLEADTTPAAPLEADQPDVAALPSNVPGGTPTPESDLPSETAATVLAWSGTLSLDIPQGTLETAAALRLPTAGADDTGLRDALANRLSDIDCARVQTVYDPESGAIDLRGHVKTDADRTQLMERVSQELGGALPLNDRLRRLDAPQCTVLVRLAEMPLPQSVEQLTNPLIIGDDLQTRTYTYRDGQTINFDLAGADYDGWLYLDFYDSEGQVLHLIPNEFIAPLILPAETPMAFGDGSEGDPARGKFEMRVNPPYGQDIAVAMVANQPLFETTRATVEPAAPYLETLAARVEELRRTRPGFKGEWVYLFIETRPGG